LGPLHTSVVFVDNKLRSQSGKNSTIQYTIISVSTLFYNMTLIRPFRYEVVHDMTTWDYSQYATQYTGL